MTVLRIAYYGDPVLRKKTERVNEITPELRQLVEDMFETMHAYDGVGLAAPQIHLSISLFVAEVPIEIKKGEWVDGPRKVFINPRILEYSDEYTAREEGCLSIPKLYGTVIRPHRVKIEATDLEGNRFQAEYTGLEARCFMHENDHINGTLFIDRVDPKERRSLETQLREIKKRYQNKK